MYVRPAITLLLALPGIVGPGLADAQTVIAEHTRQSDVIYGRKFGLSLTMEVFAPVAGNGRGVVWVVSSSGNSNREQTLQPSFERRISPLLAHGYTVFAVIHGSAPIFQVQDHVRDVTQAVRFIRLHARDFRVDGKQLGIGGSSSGGLIALIVALHGDDGNQSSTDATDRTSSRVQAAGSFFPPTDFVNFGGERQNILDVMRERGDSNPSFALYDVDAKTGAQTLVTNRDRLLAMLRQISPVTHVTPDDPPTILIHGDADKAVPIQQSRRLIERLSEAKVPARLVVREGMAHAWPGWEADTELIAGWFDTYLRP